MKRLFLIVAVTLLHVAAPFLIWRLLDDPLTRRAAYLVGEWHSNQDERTIVRIRCDEGGANIFVQDPKSRCFNSYSLHYGACLYFTDSYGRRIDLFYSPEADILLLMPGGTFKRIHSPNHQND